MVLDAPARSHARHEPQDRLSRGLLVALRHRGGNPFLPRQRLRAAQRLASGLTPAEAARAEGCEPGAIEALLDRKGFRGLVESCKALAERPEAEQIRRLVLLARQTIELALADWDTGAAFFVLREHDQGRDPARTLAERVLARVRALPTPAPAPPAGASPSTVPRPAAAADGHDPLDALVRRRAAALEGATLAEHAVRTAATAAAAPPPDPPAGVAATIRAGHRAAVAPARAGRPDPAGARRGATAGRARSTRVARAEPQHRSRPLAAPAASAVSLEKRVPNPAVYRRTHPENSRFSPPPPAARSGTGAPTYPQMAFGP